jgi:hypothetical protein
MKNFLKLKKSSTKARSKVVVGGTKKKKRNLLKAVYFSILAVLLLSTVGYTGLNYYKGHQLKAKADSWTYIKLNGLPEQYEPLAYGCKVSVNSIYGPLWLVKVLVIRNNTAVAAHIENVYRQGKYVSSVSGWTWYLGAFSQTQFYTTQLLGDTFSIQWLTRLSNGSYLTHLYNYGIYPTNLTNC